MSLSQVVGCVSAACSVLVVSFLGFTVGNSIAGTDCITRTESGTEFCVGRAQLVKVGQYTSLSLLLDRGKQETNKSMLSVQVNDDWLIVGVTADSEHITTPPPQVLIKNGSGEVILFGNKAGRTVVQFHCELNETLSNHSVCQFSLENLYFLQREVSFINSLPVKVVSYIVGWIYCFVWSFYYYPQMFLNFKRCSVSGLSLNRVFLSFTGSVAYAIFNVGLYWLPELQEEYYRRHPGGVIPVLLNDVVFALHSLFAAGVWVLQVIFIKDRGPGIKWYCAVFISSLWLLMLSTVVVSAIGFLKWLDALYIISYVKIVALALQYAPQVWVNYRCKSTEGCSAYSPMLAVLGGVFSVLQMFLLSYNYDDWTSIFGDLTKFGIGMLAIFFCLFILFQHFVLYRKSWMKKYELPPACSCEPGCCKCSKEETIHCKKSYRKISDTVALPDEKLRLKSMAIFV